MSRAFTREIDNAPDAPTPERVVSDAPNLVTESGAEAISRRLDDLDAAIRAGVDTAASAELLREQRYWAARQASMQIVPADANPAAVGFGVSARIRRRGRLSTIRIVGEDEADPTNGLLAWTSPLAEALEGAEPGEIVEFEAAGRRELIEVLGLL